MKYFNCLVKGVDGERGDVLCSRGVQPAGLWVMQERTVSRG